MAGTGTDRKYFSKTGFFPSKELEELYFTVAEFFSVNNERLEFLKNNAAAKQFQDYMNDKVFKAG
ncbi:MAG: hypothetical protein Ct9H300mP28_01940 [Pseudomonadota bacterium]|nr:MAG: hypothetical protein Ct9H300mP28_01940 [Pseudomonadota bacterium]